MHNVVPLDELLGIDVTKLDEVNTFRDVVIALDDVDKVLVTAVDVEDEDAAQKR